MTSNSPVVEKSQGDSSPAKTSVLGVSITIAPKQKILQYLLEKRTDANPHSTSASATRQTSYARVVVTPNPEQLVYAHDHSWYQKLLNQADVSLPDGIGVVWAIRQLKIQDSRSKIQRIPGVEFMEELLVEAAKHHFSVAFLGGATAGEALQRAQEKYPGLSGWSQELPMMKVVDGRLILDHLDKLLADVRKRIIDTKTSIVFVGLGAPKQELFIHQLSTPSVYMSVGGSFDILAWKTPRAPQWFRDLKLEWLWRLVVEPWRWRRQLALFRFVWLVLRTNRFSLSNLTQ